MKALRKVQPAWYTPESEAGNEKPTRFKLKPMTPSEYESVAEFINGRLRVPIENWDRVLRIGVVDWENFEGEEGVIPFGIQHLDRIPEMDRIEMTMEIISRTDLSGEEKKT